MEAKEYKIIDILTENKKYVIPSYQRPYSWTVDNVTELLDDIYQSYISNNAEYFVGSMICVNKGDNKFEVVDGQQRLTTLSLILAQLKEKIAAPGVKGDLQKRILPIDVYSDQPEEPRLTVRQKEADLYRYYLLQGKFDYKPEKPTYTQTLFLENYQTIGEYFDGKSEEELRNFSRYILQNVYVVFVQTNDFSSSFRLFNVLNSRGLPLSGADLLKNALFESAQKNKKSAQQVEDAWTLIEEMIGVEKLDKFLTLHMLSEKKDRDRVLEKDLYKFGPGAKTNFSDDPVKVSLTLLNSARSYVRLWENDFNASSLKRRIASLAQLSTDEWYPPLMAFQNRITQQKDLTWEQFGVFVELFEKVYMHGWLKKAIKSQREMVTYSALVAINHGRPFIDILQQVAAHADNEGFLAALDSDIYEPRPNQVNLLKTILLRIDQEMQDNSVVKSYTGRITIEHVLPQRPSHIYWSERFSETDHRAWLHRLGNLTLVSGNKNSEAQNSDFGKKKLVFEKLNDKVSFDITKDICSYSEWNVATLEDRHRRLANILKKIWLVPDTIH
jgi:hypothetical protein